MEKTMSLRAPLVLIFAVGLIVAACSASPGTPAPTTSPTGPLTVQVKLTDALRMEPATITVKVGQPIHFVVDNSGALEHEFFLGDVAAQKAHGEEMLGQPGMVHDEPMGIGLMPGMMKTLDHTFTTPGTLEAGCHVNDHYAAGMKMVITVQP
jgi:uncharacterized cupredoxin-like copper-binding protein